MYVQFGWHDFTTIFPGLALQSTATVFSIKINTAKRRTVQIESRDPKIKRKLNNSKTSRRWPWRSRMIDWYCLVWKWTIWKFAMFKVTKADIFFIRHVIGFYNDKNLEKFWWKSKNGRVCNFYLLTKHDLLLFLTFFCQNKDIKRKKENNFVYFVQFQEQIYVISFGQILLKYFNLEDYREEKT